MGVVDVFFLKKCFECVLFIVCDCSGGGIYDVLFF